MPKSRRAGRQLKVTIVPKNRSTPTKANLPALAMAIRQNIRKGEKSFASTVEFAIQAGKHLIEAKQLIKHGEWLDWLQNKCGIEPWRASQFMRIARACSDPNCARAQFGSLRQALAGLPKPTSKAQRQNKSKADEAEDDDEEDDTDVDDSASQDDETDDDEASDPDEAADDDQGGHDATNDEFEFDDDDSPEAAERAHRRRRIQRLTADDQLNDQDQRLLRAADDVVDDLSAKVISYAWKRAGEVFASDEFADCDRFLVAELIGARLKDQLDPQIQFLPVYLEALGLQD